MSDEKTNGFAQLLDGIGKLVAILMILRYAALIAENYVHFLPTEGFVVDLINYIGLYAPMVLMTTVGLEAVWDKSDILKLVIMICCAAIIIFTFFPGTWETIVNYTGIAG